MIAILAAIFSSILGLLVAAVLATVAIITFIVIKVFLIIAYTSIAQIWEYMLNSIYFVGDLTISQSLVGITAIVILVMPLYIVTPTIAGVVVAATLIVTTAEWFVRAILHMWRCSRTTAAIAAV